MTPVKRRKSRLPSPKSIGLVAVLSGVAIMAAGAVLYLYHPAPRHSVQTTGTVSTLYKALDQNNDGQTEHYAIITFTAANGRSYSVNGYKHAADIYKVGDRVKIAYNPANPNVARDMSDVHAPLLSYILLALPPLILFFYIILRIYDWSGNADPEEDEDPKTETAKPKQV